MLRHVVVAIFMSLFLLPVSAAKAGIEYVTVEAHGTGDTLSHAIASALKDALMQVNGAQMAASSVTSEAMAAIDTDAGSAFASASVSSESIAAQTKGAVRSYQLLRKTQEDGVWVTTVQATVARYAASPQANRLRMAIVPFRLTSPDQATFRDSFVQVLSSHLTQSRKFAMLDREYGDEQDAELASMASSDAPVEEMAKLGNKLGTDYLIVGTIQRARASTRSVTVAAMNKTLKVTSSSAAVAYRIIDAATGQIKLSDTWSGGGDNIALASLAQKAGGDIARQIVEAIFPVAVETIDGQHLVLGQGGTTLREGQVYRLIRYGQPITDRYTGESLGREELPVGMVKIVNVQPKMARALVIETTVNLTEVFAPGDFIVRLHRQAASGGDAAPSPSNVFEKQKKSIDDMSKKAEDDW